MRRRCAAHDAASLRQHGDHAHGRAVDERHRLRNSPQVLVVHEPVDEVVVHLRENRRRYVGGALAANREVHAELSALLDDFLEGLQPIVPPALTLALRGVRQDVVGLVDDEVNARVKVVLAAPLLLLVEVFRNDEGDNPLLILIDLQERKHSDGLLDLSEHVAGAHLIQLRGILELGDIPADPRRDVFANDAPPHATAPDSGEGR